MRNKDWKNYGGRGIRVCQRWRLFKNFLADMGRRPTPKHTLERVDNDNDYWPGNCVWATRLEQNRNKRNSRNRLPKPVGSAIGPSSDDYYHFMNARADLDARIADNTFNRLTGYEIWRNAWLACEAAHGIRPNFPLA